MIKIHSALSVVFLFSQALNMVTFSSGSVTTIIESL